MHLLILFYLVIERGIRDFRRQLFLRILLNQEAVVAIHCMRFEVRFLSLSGLNIFFALLVVFPVAMVLYGSFKSGTPLDPGAAFTLANYLKVQQDARFISSIVNTFAFTLGKVLTSMVIGIFMAWVLSRTNTPFRRIFEALVIIPFLFPKLILAMVWIFLGSPKIGILNGFIQRLLGLNMAPFNIYSVAGMAWVAGLYSLPLVYLLMSSAFTSMDPAVEQAGRVCGMSRMKAFFSLSLPLLRPAILSAALLVFMFGLEDFDIPLILGTEANSYVYTTTIYYFLRISLPPDYGTAGAYSVILLAISLAVLFFYRRSVSVRERFATITGRGFKPDMIDLGKWKYVTFAVCCVLVIIISVLPLFIVFLGALTPFYGDLNLNLFSQLSLSRYFRAFSLPSTIPAYINTIFVSAISASIATLFGVIVAYIGIKSRGTLGSLTEYLVMLSLGIPGLVMAYGYLWAYVNFPFEVYGTLSILVLAYTASRLPTAVRTVSPSVMQVGAELEDAARISGGSWLYTFKNVLIPLYWPGLSITWILTFIGLLGEFSLAQILYPQVITPYIFYLWDRGEIGAALALSTLKILIYIPVIFTVRRSRGFLSR
jgi:iron(III) transport system permease protein